MNKISDNNQSTYFLATTALEEFWDTSKPLLFLGEWCRRNSRKSFWEPLRGKVLVSPWHDVQQLHKAYHYVADLYERLLPLLGDALNSVHQVDHGTRYWRIILGPWLLYYLPVIYDRYTCLRTALDNYPGVTSIVLAEEKWVIPGDTLEYMQLIKDDLYNLQLYSRILSIWGYNFTQKTSSVAARPFSTEKNLPCWKKRFSDFLANKLAGLGKRGKADRSIIFRNSYFPLGIELQLFMKSFGKIWRAPGGPTPIPRLPPNTPARLKLQKILSAENEFEGLLNQMLPLDVPYSFLEGFEGLRQAAKRLYPSKPKAIFSSVAWYFDEAFKHWAAAAAGNGPQLLGMQHGGNYGSLAYHPSEDHEIAVTDRFFSWGWERSDHGDKVTPWFATKLVGRKPLHADTQKTGVLFAATIAPRYLFQFPQTPDRFQQYLQWQFRFLAVMDPRLHAKIRVRFHAEDFDWDIAERWRILHPEIRVETWDVPFLRSLESCRLYVCDHLATTFLEALSADKPTILFWDPAINELRPEAQPYYDRLRAAGILHDNPEVAAEKVNEVYDNVVTWWNDPARQEARRLFCHRFAWTSSNAVNEWIKEFKRLSEGTL